MKNLKKYLKKLSIQMAVLLIYCIVVVLVKYKNGTIKVVPDVAIFIVVLVTIVFAQLFIRFYKKEPELDK
jgi:membrane protein YdbS with pleckstrin-like domain